jgi:hypothetical protein
LEIDTRLMGAVMTKIDRRLTLTETILSHCQTSFDGKFFAQIRTDTTSVTHVDTARQFLNMTAEAGRRKITGKWQKK